VLEITRNTARLLTLLAALMWGTSFVAIRWGLQYIPSMVFVFLRFSVATLMFIPIILLLEKNESKLKDALKDRTLVFLSLFNALGFVFQFAGQELTIATNAALLVNTNAIMVAILSYIFLREKLRRIGILGVFLASFGTVLLLTQGNIGYLFTKYFIGDLLCLLSGLSWAFYIVLSKKAVISEKYHPMLIVFVWILYTSLFTFPLALFQIIISGFIITKEGAMAILYTASFCTTFAFIFWYVGLQRLEATTSSVYFLIEILITAILETIIFGETLYTFFRIMGGLLIIVGIVLTDIGSHALSIESSRKTACPEK